jgi:hypothetical protein
MPTQKITPPAGYSLKESPDTSDIRPPAGYTLQSSSQPTPGSQVKPSFLSTVTGRIGNNVQGLLKPLAHPIDSMLNNAGWSDPSSMGSLLEDIATDPDKMHGLANALGDTATFGLMAGAGELAGKLPVAGKNFIRGNITEKIPGSTVTPLQRYLNAKELGVNLDAADATNSPKLQAVKHLNENSLFGGPRYEKLKGQNTGALQDVTEGLLDSMYTGDRESGGRMIQDALKTNQGGLRSGAEAGFQQLSDATKGTRIAGAPAVGDMATKLRGKIEPLASRYPSLAPNQTIKVLQDLSKVGVTPKPPAPSFLDAPGSEFAVEQKTPTSPPDTWSDLQRLRSATHDFTVSNPDLVKSQALAPLQVMTSALDDAMTNASSGLTPEQQRLFRSSNAQWKDMKETFDDPSSPYYHAVRTSNPSTLYGGIGPKTPENAVGLRGRLSPFDQYPNGPSDALGAIRRGTVEGALKENAEGAPNFQRFAGRLRTIPGDYRAELFSPDQNAQLERIATTSNVIAKDFNPSGSGKLGQKVAEAAAFLPTAGAPLLQYPIARAMTSPRAVEFLMSPGQQRPLFGKLGMVSGLSARGQDRHQPRLPNSLSSLKKAKH